MTDYHEGCSSVMGHGETYCKGHYCDLCRLTAILPLYQSPPAADIPIDNWARQSNSPVMDGKYPTNKDITNETD